MCTITTHTTSMNSVRTDHTPGFPKLENYKLSTKSTVSVNHCFTEINYGLIHKLGRSAKSFVNFWTYSFLLRQHSTTINSKHLASYVDYSVVCVEIPRRLAGLTPAIEQQLAVTRMP